MPELHDALDAEARRRQPSGQPPFAHVITAHRRRRARRRVYLAAAVAVVLAGTGAGSALLLQSRNGEETLQGAGPSAAPSTGPTATASASAAPTPSSTAPSQVAIPCRDEDLIAVATGGGPISNGQAGATIRLTNVGPTACWLPARPTSLGTTDMPVPTEPTAGDPGSPQTLPAGGVAAFDISITRLHGSGNCLRPAPASESAPKQLVIKFDHTSAAIVAGLIGGGPFTLDCWPVRVGSLYLPDASSAPGPSAMWPADGDVPVAGACASPPGPDALIEVNPDQPMPRCTFVRSDQRVRVRNTSNRFSQPGQPVVVWFAGYPARTIPVGGETVFDQPAGQYLAPGVHDLRLSLFRGSGGAEIFLQK